MNSGFESASPTKFFLPVAPGVASQLLGIWAPQAGADWIITGRSLFGDIFLRHPDGAVYMLDLIAGEVKQIACCVEEFEYDLGQERGRNEWLMSALAQQLIASGVCPGDIECFAFRTPPILGGQLHPSNVVLWDLIKYHTGLSKLLSQIKDLPPGTQVVPH